MNKTELAGTVKAAQTGDKEAIEKLYRQYRGRIWFFVRKNVSSQAAAEDIVSDTFLTAIEKLPDLHRPESFGSWLYSIAYRKCTDYLNSESEKAHFDSCEELDRTVENAALSEPVMIPIDYIENEETKQLLREAIDSLKPETRSAIIMYYFEQLSVAEVAKALGLKENTAKQRLYAARKKLAAKLKKLSKNTSALCAVPIGAVINSALESSRAAVSTGTASVAAAGFSVRLAAVGVSAALALGVPIALHDFDSCGDYRPQNTIVSQTDPNSQEAADLLERLKGKSFDYRFETCPDAQLLVQTESPSKPELLVDTDHEDIEQGQMYDYGLSQLLLSDRKNWKLTLKDTDSEAGQTCMTHFYKDLDMQIKLYCTSDNQTHRHSVYRLYLPKANSDKFICIEYTDPEQGRFILDDMHSHRIKSADLAAQRLFYLHKQTNGNTAQSFTAEDIDLNAAYSGNDKIDITLSPDINILQDTGGMYFEVSALQNETGKSIPCPMSVNGEKHTTGSAEKYCIRFDVNRTPSQQANSTKIEITAVPSDCSRVNIKISFKLKNEVCGKTADRSISITLDISNARAPQGKG